MGSRWESLLVDVFPREISYIYAGVVTTFIIFVIGLIIITDQLNNIDFNINTSIIIIHVTIIINVENSLFTTNSRNIITINTLTHSSQSPLFTWSWASPDFVCCQELGQWKSLSSHSCSYWDFAPSPVRLRNCSTDMRACLLRTFSTHNQTSFAYNMSNYIKKFNE